MRQNEKISKVLTDFFQGEVVKEIAYGESYTREVLISFESGKTLTLYMKRSTPYDEEEIKYKTEE